MNELDQLKQWASKGYDVSLRYGIAFDAPDKFKLEWRCEIYMRSIGSIHIFPIPRATGIHPIDPIEAIRAALIQAETELTNADRIPLDF